MYKGAECSLVTPKWNKIQPYLGSLRGLSPLKESEAPRLLVGELHFIKSNLYTFYFTTSTEQGERAITLSATEPIKSFCNPVLPWVPTTIRSTFFTCAVVVIAS